MVTSTDSGLSVPDWPTTYGWNMFTFPLSKWVGGIRYEHSHRLIASTVGFLTIILADGPGGSSRGAGSGGSASSALGAVIVQGLLGGLTVLFFLPPPISIGHAGLAQIFFCLTVTLALVTSPGWKNASEPVDDAMLRRGGGRHDGPRLHADHRRRDDAAQRRRAGDSGFPLAFGQIIPPVWNAGVAIHFAHRVGALIVTLAILATAGHVFYHHSRRRELARPGAPAGVPGSMQITLGAFVIWSGKDR